MEERYFSRNAILVIEIATGEAKKNLNFIELEHLFIGVLKLKNHILVERDDEFFQVKKFLEKNNLDKTKLDILKEKIRKGFKKSNVKDVSFSEDANRVLLRAEEIKEEYYLEKITAIAILLSIFENLNENLENILKEFSIKKDEAIKQIKEEIIKNQHYKMLGISASRYDFLKSIDWDYVGEKLKEKILGQEEAINKIINQLKIFSSGLVERRGPIAVFFLAGPTGVGKTESAIVLAETIFGSKERLVRLDMSEYMHSHETSKLIGAPPGYVGYGEEGKLTGPIIKNPFSLVLIDEIEKAHPDVLNLFLQIFDYGKITDSKNVQVDFKKAIFVITSNLGAEIYNKRMVGFKGSFEEKKNEINNIVIEEIRKKLKPEFFNRIDDLIIFNPLDKNTLIKILKNLMLNFKRKLKMLYDVDIVFKDEILNFLAEMREEFNLGARQVVRNFNEGITEKVINFLMEKKVFSGFKIKIRLQEGEIWMDLYYPSSSKKTIDKYIERDFKAIIMVIDICESTRISGEVGGEKNIIRFKIYLEQSISQSFKGLNYFQKDTGDGALLIFEENNLESDEILKRSINLFEILKKVKMEKNLDFYIRITLHCGEVYLLKNKDFFSFNINFAFKVDKLNRESIICTKSCFIEKLRERDRIIMTDDFYNNLRDEKDKAIPIGYFENPFYIKHPRAKIYQVDF